jgi:CHAD domain-containing protein
MLQALGEGDVRALHRTRVATRRLREILPVLQLKAELADRLGRRLKKVTVQLGAVRELDVLSNLMEELKAAGRCDPQALRRVASAIGRERTQARKKLYAKLPTRNLERIARKLEKVGDDLRERKPARGWQWAVDARVSRRASTVLHALDAAGTMYLPERLHEARIAVKKLRYALEVAGEAAGTKRSPDIRALKRPQETLGRLHDVQVLVERIREMQATLASPDFTMWRKVDGLIALLEDDCRRLHAKFARQEIAVRAICQRVSRDTNVTPQPRRAVAS